MSRPGRGLGARMQGRASRLTLRSLPHSPRPGPAARAREPAHGQPAGGHVGAAAAREPERDHPGLQGKPLAQRALPPGHRGTTPRVAWSALPATWGLGPAALCVLRQHAAALTLGPERIAEGLAQLGPPPPGPGVGEAHGAASSPSLPGRPARPGGLGQQQVIIIIANMDQGNRGCREARGP